MQPELSGRREFIGRQYGKGTRAFSLGPLPCEMLDRPRSREVQQTAGGPAWGNAEVAISLWASSEERQSHRREKRTWALDFSPSFESHDPLLD